MPTHLRRTRRITGIQIWHHPGQLHSTPPAGPLGHIRPLCYGQANSRFIHGSPPLSATKRMMCTNNGGRRCALGWGSAWFAHPACWLYHCKCKCNYSWLWIHSHTHNVAWAVMVMHEAQRVQRHLFANLGYVTVGAREASGSWRGAAGARGTGRSVGRRLYAKKGGI